ncbi:glycoside hydrolase family 105 protein [Rufibacter glacialis]|uniref:Glycoside hydrolase family 105 protein n=1 Tax=Rufibacter glacialis TaxID=1259555 RepID=A0A5M8Q7R1_9BACT|nr:glycoside hydrolase family 88 protein [Rufibacter glacialis]KAA6430662.1 glycoside hydrolase family 88 protein [Rufibacter glacialis]GGK85546.1 family 88 glycosyl hydrolase [Rufibacter glacialis]
MKLSNIAFLALALFTLACSTSKQTSSSGVPSKSPSGKPYSVWMADSEMKRSPQGWMIDFRPEPKWDYTQGLFASALERVWKRTGDQKYFTYIKAFADTMITENGTIKTYKKADYNIDRVNPGKFLIALHRETGKQKYKIALDDLRDQMRTHPRTSEGGYWHKKIYPHQMWLDGLYMASPFLAQYAATYNEPQLFNEVAKQIKLVDKYTYVKEKNLFYHGWDEKREQKWADPKTGLSPNVWGRAMGWYAMALVDALDFMPVNHPERADILKITQKMAGSLAQYQDRETGLWWQVVDQANREGNYREGSASSMFTYFLVKAAKKGYIDQKYMDNARRGYNGILENLIRKEADGTISITNVCAVAGLGGTPYRDGTYEYYINEEKRDNDPKAVSPFIMAALEFEEMGGKTSVSKSASK